MKQQTAYQQTVSKVEQQTYDKMFDSEYLAFFMATVVKHNPEVMSEYTFQRIDKILAELARQEMI